MSLKILPILVLLFVLASCEQRSQFDLLHSPPPELLAEVEPLIQPSIDFTLANQQLAFEQGKVLSAEQKQLAQRIGIQDIDKIRVLYVDDFPLPEDKKLLALAKKIGIDSPYTAGFTYGYGIFIRKGKDFVLPHELIHVRQFEKLGIEAFLKRYMLELAVMGYRAAPLEVEAYTESGNYQLPN